MFGLKQNREVQFATCQDFQKIFAEDMGSLHQLSLLLTADEARAEECFVAGLEGSIQGNPVFRQWARSWSKRAIIKTAIKAFAPSPSASDSAEARQTKAAVASRFKSGDAQKDALLAAALKLDGFTRFVFVMSVLEGYSERECSALLDCTLQDVSTAKTEALRAVVSRQPQVRAEGKRFLLPRLANNVA